jgi:hypothetical protein
MERYEIINQYRETMVSISGFDPAILTLCIEQVYKENKANDRAWRGMGWRP